MRIFISVFAGGIMQLAAKNGALTKCWLVFTWRLSVMQNVNIQLTKHTDTSSATLSIEKWTSRGEPDFGLGSGYLSPPQKNGKVNISWRAFDLRSHPPPPPTKWRKWTFSHGQLWLGAFPFPLKMKRRGFGRLTVFGWLPECTMWRLSCEPEGVSFEMWTFLEQLKIYGGYKGISFAMLGKYQFGILEFNCESRKKLNSRFHRSNK